MSDAIHMQLALNRAPQEIYRALTDSAALEAWFSESAEVSLLEKRYDFWGRFTPGTPDREGGRHPILEASPDQRLRYAWEFGEYGTTVDFRLRPHSDRTVVILQHTKDQAEAKVPWGGEDFWFLSLENLRRYLDGREVVRCDFSVAPTVYGDIEQSVEVDAPPERVFETLIDPQQLERWIASRARVEPRVGGVYDIGWELSGTVKILELEPGARLVYSWAAYQDEPETVVTWTLEGSGGKTRLTIVQSGFDPEIPLDGLYTGWLHYLQRIKSLVEYGEDWQPAIKQISPEAYSYYAAPIVAGQNDLLEV